MAKPTEVVTVRLPVELTKEVDRIVKEANIGIEFGGTDRSQFIRQAIVEKLNHRARSRKRGTKAVAVCCVCNQSLPIDCFRDKLFDLYGKEQFLCISCTLPL